MKATYIEWLDACGSQSNAWQSNDDLHTGLLEVQSAGLIIHEDDDSITLVHSKTNSQFMGDVTISKISITKRVDYA